MTTRLSSCYTVRFNDCDPLGHLNNARYIDYFLNAREDHLKEYYQIDLRQFAAKGVSWVVTAHEILYIRPVVYNDRVTIQSETIEVGESHLLVEMLLFDESAENLKAIMWTRFTHISLKTGKRELHSEEFMDFARTTLSPGRDLQGGLKARVEELMQR